MSRAGKIGFAILNATTRSWPAFWATIGLCIAYVFVNTTEHYTFDPYPYTFLILLVSLLSYLQNVVIMTFQRDAEELQRKQAIYMLALLESERDMLKELSSYVDSVRVDCGPSRKGMERDQ